MTEICVGTGPCGELRYPAYQEKGGKWSYFGDAFAVQPGCALINLVCTVWQLLVLENSKAGCWFAKYISCFDIRRVRKMPFVLIARNTLQCEPFCR